MLFNCSYIMIDGHYYIGKISKFLKLPFVYTYFYIVKTEDPKKVLKETCLLYEI